MPTPLELCLEDLDPASGADPLRCVALPGGEPGLVLDARGAVRWMPADALDHGLWVSTDERLILLRGEGAGPIAVSRAGRTLDAEVGKPVVLRDQDLLLVGGRRLRVHLHGATALVHPPERLSRTALARAARAAAAALALGAALGASEGQAAPPPIEVRANPPGATPARPLDCAVTSLTRDASGVYLVHARCPSDRELAVGARGTLLDASGTPLRDGAVVVKQARRSTIVAESTLRKPVKAATVRFYVRW